VPSFIHRCRLGLAISLRATMISGGAVDLIHVMRRSRGRDVRACSWLRSSSQCRARRAAFVTSKKRVGGWLFEAWSRRSRPLPRAPILESGWSPEGGKAAPAATTSLRTGHPTDLSPGDLVGASGVQSLLIGAPLAPSLGPGPFLAKVVSRRLLIDPPRAGPTSSNAPHNPSVKRTPPC
jgi:hypothetical protein